MNNNVLNKALQCKLAIRSSLCQLYEFISQNIFETFFLVNQQFTITGKGGLAGHLNPNPKHKSLRYGNSESLWIPWATNSHFSKTRGLSYFVPPIFQLIIVTDYLNSSKSLVHSCIPSDNMSPIVSWSVCAGSATSKPSTSPWYSNKLPVPAVIENGEGGTAMSSDSIFRADTSLTL